MAYQARRQPTPEVLELLERMCGTPLGGYPRLSEVLRIVSEFFADFGLTIDDDPEEIRRAARTAPPTEREGDQ